MAVKKSKHVSKDAQEKRRRRKRVCDVSVHSPLTGEMTSPQGFKGNVPTGLWKVPF